MWEWKYVDRMMKELSFRRRSQSRRWCFLRSSQALLETVLSDETQEAWLPSGDQALSVSNRSDPVDGSEQGVVCWCQRQRENDRGFENIRMQINAWWWASVRASDSEQCLILVHGTTILRSMRHFASVERTFSSGSGTDSTRSIPLAVRTSVHATSRS